MERPRPPTEPSTGFRWFAHVPSGWSARRLQYSAILYSGGTPNTNDPGYWENGTIPWLSSGEINKKSIYDSEAFITPHGLADSSAKMVPPKSVLIALNGQGKTKGTVARLEFSSSINQSLACIIPTKDFDYGYIYYFLESKYEQIRGLKGEDRDGLNMPLLKSIILPQPPLPIQTAIVSYLDDESFRIDALISKKERQIELLQEKRKAIITRAITKGLDLNAKMRDSEVEWIGQIPESWQVVRLKHLVSNIVDCHHDTPDYVEDGDYPAIRTSDLSEGILDISNARRVNFQEYEKRIARLRPKPNDIIYSREGERFGKAALVPEGIELCLAQRVMLFRVNGKNSPGFSMWALNSESTLVQARLDVYGSTSPHVNVETIINFLLPTPPKDTQERVAIFISTQLNSIDEMVSRISTSINLLQEYRSSLITAAVSGQIDVSKISNGAKAHASL